MSQIPDPGRSTVDRGNHGLIFSDLVVLVVVVVPRVDLGIQIFFLPTRMQTCATPLIARTAPTREHLPATALAGEAVDGVIVNALIDTAAARNHCLRLTYQPPPTANCPRSFCR